MHTVHPKEKLMYYLLGVKQSAWVTRTGQYSTDIKEAQQFDRDSALVRCRTHRGAANILVPVLIADMEAI